MSFHTVAFAKSVLTSGTKQAINSINDPSTPLTGNGYVVPVKYNQLIGGASLVKANAGTRSQFQSPTLREVLFPEVQPVVISANFTDWSQFVNLSQTPVPLSTNEELDFFSDAGGNGTTAQDVYGLGWLSDDKITPVTGKIYSVYATASVTLAARTWVNGALTFDQSLPVGNYDIVGLRAIGTGLVAARFVFIGASSITRPGVMAQSNAQAADFEQFREGRFGVFGSFFTTAPPSIDCLGDTGTSQTFVIDLIQR